MTYQPCLGTVYYIRRMLLDENIIMSIAAAQHGGAHGSNLKLNMTVKGVSAAVYGMILATHAAPLPYKVDTAPYSIFKTSNFLYYNRLPKFEEVYTFIYRLFRKAQVEPECLVASVVYLDMFLNLNPCKVAISSETWERLVFTCIMIASKVWDDISCSSRSFALCASDFSLRDLNLMERLISRDLEYAYFLTADDYKEYYYQLKGVWTHLALTESMDIVQMPTVPKGIDGAKWGMKYVFTGVTNIKTGVGTRSSSVSSIQLEGPVVRERLPVRS